MVANLVSLDCRSFGYVIFVPMHVLKDDYTWQWLIHLAPPVFISALLSMPVYMVGCIWCLEKTSSVVHQLVTSLLEVSSIISGWLHWKLLQNSFTWFPSDVECTKHCEKNDRSESGTSHLIRLCAPASYCLVCILHATTSTGPNKMKLLYLYW